MNSRRSSEFNHNHSEVEDSSDVPQSETSGEGVFHTEIQSQRAAAGKSALVAVETDQEPLTRGQVKEVLKQLPAIALVDDERIMLSSLRRMLGIYAHKDTITPFQDPFELMNSLSDLPDQSLIVSDNDMKANINGLELAQLVHKQFADKDFTFVLYSGDGGQAFKAEVENAKDHGFIDAFVSKSASPQELLSILAQNVMKTFPLKD